MLLRAVGGQLYYYVMQAVYGFGDYTGYYAHGLRYAEGILTGTTEQVDSYWLVQTCCSGFMVRVSGIVLAVLGPDINAIFLLFSLIGYAGIVAMATAFGREYPEVPRVRYLLWVAVLPSLWFWPSALGKDALLLAGTGVATLGFVGKRGQTSWLPLALGSALVFAVRPQVAAVMVFTMIAAHWFSGREKWTLRWVVRGAALGVAGVYVLFVTMRMIGLSDIATLDEYLDTRATITSGMGGSSMEVASGPTAVIQGFVNVLFRPFLWESAGGALALSALELTILWVVAAWKRHDILHFYRTHKHSRLLWFGTLFVVVYSVLLGMALGNLGLLARQRVHIFPFLFIPFAGRALRGHEEETAHDSSTRMPL